jgi:hypothetical protein
MRREIKLTYLRLILTHAAGLAKEITCSIYASNSLLELGTLNSLKGAGKKPIAFALSQEHDVST